MTSMGLGEGAGEEDRVGWRIGKGEDRERGAKDYKRAVSSVKNALQCMFVSLPLPVFMQWNSS